MIIATPHGIQNRESEPRTLVIGDVHGKIQLLMDLLEKAKPTLDDVVIQVGDLGNFVAKSWAGDKACYDLAHRTGMNVIMGNHDAPVFGITSFGGYMPPSPECTSKMIKVFACKTGFSVDNFIMRAHGYTITHAGIHPLNTAPATDTLEYISAHRGGKHPFGGILWRDIDEDLSKEPQIFGHSCDSTIRRINGNSFCIDSSKKGSLIGMWLPDLTIVAVGENVEFLENPNNIEEI